MPLQQINLDQSIYSKAIQNRMTPQGAKKYTGPTGPYPGGEYGLPSTGGMSDAEKLYEEKTHGSLSEQQKATWAAEDKATKQQRDIQMQQAQEVGMRVAGQAQKEQQQVQQQQLATKQQVESNPEPAAKEMYNLMLTLPDEAKQQLLAQLFAPIPNTGGSMSSGGKTVQMPSKYNPIAGVFLEKGWAMFDPKGNVSLSEPEAVPEKGTYTMNANGDVLDTSTGNIVLNKADIPKGITSADLLDIMKEGRAYVTGLVDPSYIESLTPEGRAEFFTNADKKFKDHVTWLLQKTYNLTLDEATAMANKMPKQEEVTAPTGGSATKTDNTIVSDLKKLFDENPDQINKRKLYEDKYGAENVAAALGETSKTKPTTESITKEFKALGYPTSPAKK